MSRETRLLVVTITVSVLVLVLLSRFRFPERPPVAAPVPAPLDRIAARAASEELVGIVAALERTVRPRMLVLRVAMPGGRDPRTLSDALGPVAFEAGDRYIPALHITPTAAVAAIPPDAAVVGVVGQRPDAEPPRIVAADPLRGIALVEVAVRLDSNLLELSPGVLRPSTYVVIAEGTRAGLSIRPFFLGSGNQLDDPRWQRPLFAMSSAPLAGHGAFVFSTGGQFLGSVVFDSDTLAIASAGDIVESISRLSRGDAPRPLDAGLALQALTPALSSALGVERGGVVVASVAQGTLSEEVLESGDVILSVDGQSVDSPDDLLFRVAQAGPGTTLTLDVVRDGSPHEVALTLPAESTAAAGLPFGMRLTARRGGGSAVVEVAPAGAAAAAGVRAGDAIVRAGRLALPSPSQLSKLLASTDGPPFVALTLEREGHQRIVALALRAEGDGAR
jgi:hypothetical protein